MIGSLGREPSADKLTIYIKQETPSDSTTSTTTTDVEEGESASSTRLLSRYRTPASDLLRTIEEVDRRRSLTGEETYDRPSAKAPPPSTASTASEREKKRYQRTMTPNTLRSKLQEKLISSFDTNELAGTIASIQISPKESRFVRHWLHWSYLLVGFFGLFVERTFRRMTFDDSSNGRFAEWLRWTEVLPNDFWWFVKRTFRRMAFRWTDVSPNDFVERTFCRMTYNDSSNGRFAKWLFVERTICRIIFRLFVSPNLT